MARLPLFLLLGLALAASAAQAQAPVPPRPPRALMALTPEEIDPARLLPPPPMRGSVQEKAELAELHEIQDRRSPAQLAQAQWDQDHQNWVMFAATLGPRFDMAALPATAKVLRVVQNDMGIASTRAKNFYKRMRPWALDPSVRGCTLRREDDPLSSYPSGHTTDAYALGVVLAELMPDRGQAILARSADFAYSRMVCGMHYRSDLAAGQALGTAVATDILRSPKMQADLDAARAELASAGLTVRSAP
jgi:acid phosphatase (class A)